MNRQQVHPDDFYFQPLSIEKTFIRVFHLFGKGWCTFLGISLLTGALAFGATLVTLLVWGVGGYAMHGGNNNEAMQGFIGVGVVFELFILYLFQCVADAAIIRAVAEIYAGHTPSMLPCFWAAWKKAFSLLGSFFLVSVGLILLPFGLLAWNLQGLAQEGNYVPLAVVGTVFGIYACVVGFLSYAMYPVIMVENAGPIVAVGRSMYLTGGNLFYVLCTLFMWGLFKLLINVLVTSLTTMVTGNTGYATMSDDGDIHFDITFGNVGDGVVAFFLGVAMASMNSM